MSLHPHYIAVISVSKHTHTAISEEQSELLAPHPCNRIWVYIVMTLVMTTSPKWKWICATICLSAWDASLFILLKLLCICCRIWLLSANWFAYYLLSIEATICYLLSARTNICYLLVLLYSIGYCWGYHLLLFEATICYPCLRLLSVICWGYYLLLVEATTVSSRILSRLSATVSARITICYLFRLISSICWGYYLLPVAAATVYAIR